MQIFKGHTDRVRSLAYSPDGGLLASGSNDRTARVWDPASGGPLLSPSKFNRNVYSVAFSPDGRELAAAGGRWIIRAWDVAALWENVKNVIPKMGRPRCVLQGHTTTVRSLAFCGPSAVLVSGAGNPEARYPGTEKEGEAISWDREAGRPRSTVSVGGIWSLAASAASGVVALGTGYGVIMLWEPGRSSGGVHFGSEWLRGFSNRYGEWYEPSMSRRAPPVDLEMAPRSLALSPDGQTLASTAGRTVKVWDLTGKRLLAILQGHRRVVSSVAFAPDGQGLASASHDGTVRLWDVSSGSERACLDGGIGKVDSVTFAPDGMTLAAGGEADIVVFDVE
jgi:WD40 repeat protein